MEYNSRKITHCTCVITNTKRIPNHFGDCLPFAYYLCCAKMYLINFDRTAAEFRKLQHQTLINYKIMVEFSNLQEFFKNS